MNLTEFAEYSSISRATLERWQVRNEVSSIGEVALCLMLKNKELRDTIKKGKMGKEQEKLNKIKKIILDAAKKLEKF